MTLSESADSVWVHVYFFFLLQGGSVVKKNTTHNIKSGIKSDFGQILNMDIFRKLHMSNSIWPKWHFDGS